MNTAAAYDRYPLHTRMKTLVFNLSVYALGVLITFSVLPWLGYIYVFLIVVGVSHLMYTGCRDCQILKGDCIVHA